MKFSIAYYLVLLYLVVLLKPLLPLIGDAWSHEFNGLAHISLVHAKYGNNHLQKELSETASNKDGNKKQHTIHTPDDVSFHLAQPDCNYIFWLIPNDRTYISFSLDTTSLVFIPNHGPPPKVS